MIKINEKQIEQITNIEVITRNETIEQLSQIINSSLYDQFRWTKTSKCLKINDCRIELTTKKLSNGHSIVKQLNIFQEDSKGSILAWKTVDIQ